MSELNRIGESVGSDVSKRAGQSMGGAPLRIVRERWLRKRGNDVDKWRIGLDEEAAFCEHPTLRVKFATGAFIELVDIKNGYAITIADKDEKEVLFEAVAYSAEQVNKVLAREDLPEEVQAFAASVCEGVRPKSSDGTTRSAARGLSRFLGGDFNP